MSRALQFYYLIRTWGDRRIVFFIFLALWLTYGFIAGHADTFNPNIVSRIGLTFSILEDRSLRIDRFAPFTKDKALFDGFYYSDKAPGLSLTALPSVAALVSAAKAVGVEVPRISDNPFQPFYWRAVFFACLFTSGFFSAVAAAAVFLLVRHWRLSRVAASFSALLYALATPIAGWATMFFGHAMAGSLLVIAFATTVIVTETQKYASWDVGAGLLIGTLLAWSFTVEFTGAPAILIIGIFSTYRMLRLPHSRRIRLLGGAAVGGMMAAAPLVIYNDLAFGSMWHIGYEYVSRFPGMRRGFFGISTPSPAVIFQLVFGHRRGLLWISPVMVFAPIAYVYTFRYLLRDVALVLLFVPVAYLLINSGYEYWDGGSSTGPRHITPSMGFISLAFGPLWNFASLRVRVMLVVTGLISAAISLICASVDMATPENIARPLPDWILPKFFDGQIHNALTPPGSHSLWSLLVIPLLWISAGIVAASLPRRSQCT